jgi:preprotein translocase subunit SecE
MAQDGKKKKQFFKEFKAELKKVIWPTPKQIVNGTIAVITIVLIAALIVFALDSTFNLFNEQGTHALRNLIESRQDETNDEFDLNFDDDLLFEIPTDDEFDVEDDEEIE